jgi:uncharacterized membrane protein
MRPRPWLIVVLVGALAGLVFAGLSTYDFARHLDRQVHSVSCSFIPGADRQLGGSGCEAAMMSSYSSVLRGTVWGGIPISLPAMSVFAFILFFGADLALGRRQHDRRATGFLALATALPAAASVVMAIVSLTQLGTVCKVCAMIYAASAACLTGALVLWRGAAAGAPAPARPLARAPDPEPPADPAFVGGGAASGRPRALVRQTAAGAAPASLGFLGGAFAVGVVFVLVPVVLYAASAPDHRRFIGSCDGLVQPEDTYGVMVPMGGAGPGAVPAIEILDPLCPACRAFEERLDATGLRDRLDRRALLFPLDSTCNWMVDEPVHPGACAISEAVLCAGEQAGPVIAWSFAEQDRIRAAAAADAAAAERMVRARFPDLAACIGSPEVKARLNRSLRWAVANGVSVLTPQLYVDGVKLCDEDVDLGLDYTLAAMLDRHARGALVATRVTGPGRAPPPASPPPAAKPVEVPPPAPAEPPRPAEPPSASEERAPAPVAEPAAEPAAPEPAAAPPADEPAAAPPPPSEPPAEPGEAAEPGGTP